MPENWPVKIAIQNESWAEAGGVCGFDLKMLRKLCSLEQFQSFRKNFSIVRMYTQGLFQKVQGYVRFFRKRAKYLKNWAKM